MFRRHVLAALDAGIAAHDDDAARAALRRVDPVARAFARRKLERALIDAALACDAVQLHAPPSGHVMRLAALAIGKRSIESAGDPAAVEAAYAQLAKPAMPRLPVATLVTLLATVALIGSVTLYVSRGLEKPSRTYVRKMPPPTAEAFAKGGVPLRDERVEKLLAERVTKLVVHAGRARNDADNHLDSVLASLRAADPILAHGIPLTKAWDGMLDTFVRSVEAARRGPTQRERDELRESVREVTEQFIAAGLGYFIEGRFKRGYPYVQAYRVEEVVYVTTAGTPRRVLSLRRLDKLNTAYDALGMHDEDVGDPVLHLERIDENVASTVMPVLASDAAYPLADREWLLTDTGKALAARLGEVVRTEYTTALGAADAKPTAEIAKLLIRRDEIVEEWRDHLDRKRIYFVRTDGLFLPPNLLEQLEDVTPNYQRNRVREIEDRLARLEAPRIHARLHDLVAATVRRHEAQHGFDYDRDTELRYPSALADMLGPPHDGQGEEVALVRSARAELSAYLSQIANDPLTPQAALWHLGKQAFHRDRWGTGECYAAIVVLEGLARDLGATADGPRFRRGVERERLAKLALTIANASPDKLRAAAAALWSDLYGEPLTAIVDVPAKSVIAQAR